MAVTMCSGVGGTIVRIDQIVFLTKGRVVIGNKAVLQRNANRFELFDNIIGIGQRCRIPFAVFFIECALVVLEQIFLLRTDVSQLALVATKIDIELLRV